VQLGYDHRGRFAPIEQADALAELDADLVVLTEVDRGWPQAGGHDVHRLLSERLGLAATFAPAGNWLRGHAVLTDLPVTEVQRHRLPRGPGALDATLLSVVVQLDEDRSLAVLTTRLHPVEAHADVRRRQARAIAAEIARQRARGLEVVLLGDLQAEPQTPELEPLESLLTATIPVGRATWPAARPRQQLDHILISEGLEVADWTVASVGVSDHLPLAARLRPAEPDEDGP
jgi:endonuclease/exonuclease/phosphatase family metal-dependent hydrolase